MKRRHFFGALGTAIAAPVAPRRVYSFLWDNPLVTLPDEYEIRCGAYWQIWSHRPHYILLHPDDYQHLVDELCEPDPPSAG